MICVICVICFRWLCFAIPGVKLTVRVFTGYRRQPFVDLFLFVGIRSIWVKVYYLYNLRIGVLGIQLIVNLYNGTVYLYAEEVLWLPDNGDGRLESQGSVDIRCVRLADIGIARPIAVAVPCQAVRGLAVLHDGRNAVIIIGLNVIVL